MKLSKKQKSQVSIFKTLLLEKNKSINLFSRKNSYFQIKFLFDQAFLTAEKLSFVLQSSTDPILDVGSGNGFPGLLLSILYPESSFYLCESNIKKSEFLKYTLSKTNLVNARVLCQRAEEIKKPFKIIVSQAAMPSIKMLKLLENLLAKKGQAFLWKKTSWEKDWPTKSLFISEVIPSQELEALGQVLLSVKRSQE